ncbi:MAG: hypothetical protein KGL52_13010, partial [Rhodospirillales bacterium]|nr:hypothetical protein [Rhodospirillales bacterium]
MNDMVMTNWIPTITQRVRDQLVRSWTGSDADARGESAGVIGSPTHAPRDAARAPPGAGRCRVPAAGGA